MKRLATVTRDQIDAGDTEIVGRPEVDAHGIGEARGWSVAQIGGKPNPVQPELIGAAVKRMPKYSRIVAAMDADADGGKLAEVVREAVQHSQREDLVFVFQEPFGFKDWNDQLRAVPKPFIPSRPDVPSVA